MTKEELQENARRLEKEIESLKSDRKKVSSEAVKRNISGRISRLREQRKYYINAIYTLGV